jgi:uncharacterized protein YjiS (DUF1127 family)
MFKEYCNRILRAIQESQQRRADYNILMNLSDRELKDLGIGKSEIGIGKSEIREKIYGERTH